MNALQFGLASKCSRLCGNNVQRMLHDYRNITCFHFSPYKRLSSLNNVQISGSTDKWSRSQHTGKSLTRGAAEHRVFTSFLFKPSILFNKENTAAAGTRHFNNLCHLQEEQIYPHEEFQKSLDSLDEYLNRSIVDSSECRKLVLDLREIFFNETLSGKKWLLTRLELPIGCNGLSGVLTCVQDVVLPDEVSEKLNQVVGVLPERLDKIEPNDAIHIASDLLLLGRNIDSPEISKLLDKAFSPKNSLDLQSLSIGVRMFPEAVPDDHVQKLLQVCSEKDYQFDRDSDMIHFFNLVNHASQNDQNIPQSTFDTLTTISENPKLMSNVDISSKLLHLSVGMRLSLWNDRQSQEAKDWLADIIQKSSTSIIEHQNTSLTLFQSLFLTEVMTYWSAQALSEVPVNELKKVVQNMTMDVDALTLDEVVLAYRYQPNYFYQNQKEYEAFLLRNWKDMDTWLLEILVDVPPVIENPALLALIYQQLMKTDQMSPVQCVAVMNFLRTSVTPLSNQIKAKSYQRLLKHFESEEKPRLSQSQWTKFINVHPNERIRDFIWEELYQFLDSLSSQQLVRSCSILFSLRRLQSTSYKDLDIGLQVYSLSNYYENRISKHLDEVNDIQWLCIFMRSLYHKRSKLESTHVFDTQTMESMVNRTVELYFAQSTRQQNLHLANLCQTLWNINFYHPEALDKMSVTITQFDNCTMQHVYYFIKLLGIFVYTPSNMEDLKNTVERVVNENFDQCRLSFQLDLMKHLCKSRIFPDKVIKDIFSVEFMNKVNAAPTHLQLLLVKYLVTLNQYAVIDCPHLNIPWLDLHPKYIKPVTVMNRELMATNLSSRRGYWQVYVTFDGKVEEQVDHCDFVDFITTKMVNNGYLKHKPKPVTELLQAGTLSMIFRNNDETQAALRFHDTYYKGSPVFIHRTDVFLRKAHHTIFEEVRSVLFELVGKDYITYQAKLQYGLKCEFLMHMTPEGNLARKNELDGADLSSYKRLAVILPRVDFPVNKKYPYNGQRTKHLSKLGYTLITIHTHIWNSMAMSTRDDKMNYLKELIYSCHTDQNQ